MQPLNPNESDPDKAQKNKDIAENIGKKLLNSLMMATDISMFEDTDEFLNKMVEVKVNLRPATEKYSERNEIVSFSEYKGDTVPPTNSTPKAKAWANAPIKEETKQEDMPAPGPRPW